MKYKSILCALVIGAATLPAIAQLPNEPVSPTVIVGLEKISHKWHRKWKILPVRSTVWRYRLSDAPYSFDWPKKIKGIKDLRSYAEKAPIKNWMISFCERWHPVIVTGIDATQGYWLLRNQNVKLGR